MMYRMIGYVIAVLCLGGTAKAIESSGSYTAVEREMKIDSDLAKWKDVKANVVKGADKLWFGQGMTREGWQGNEDLSYSWKSAYHGNRVYFLFEVRDDQLIQAGQARSYLCDCVEIYLDCDRRKGARVVVNDGRTNSFDRCNPGELKGYELHFLPAKEPRVYLDHRSQYAIEKDHTDEFKRDWNGEVVFMKTKDGYILEIGFSVPGVILVGGKVLGVETGVCDDDGQGRKSIMMWTGTKKDFWVTMDDYGAMVLGKIVALQK